MLLLAAALLSLGGGPDGPRLEAGLRAAEGQRWLQFDSTTLPTAGLAETELDPRLALRLAGEVELELAYTPTLYLPLILSPAASRPDNPLDLGAVLQRAQARVQQNSGLWRLRATAAGALGKVDLLSAAILSGQPVPTTGGAPLKYRSLDVGVGLDGQFDRRTSLRVDVGGSASGEYDAPPTTQLNPLATQLPTQTAVTASAAVDWKASRTLSWSTQVAGTLSQTAAVTGTTTPAPASPTPTAPIVASFLRAGVGARDLVAPRLSLGAAAGVAAMQADSAPGTVLTRAFPWAEADAALAAAGAFPSLGLHLAMDPVIDRLTGVVDIRAGAEARAGVKLSPFNVEGVVATYVLQPFLPVQTNTRTLLSSCSLRIGLPVAPSVIMAGTVQGFFQHYVGPPVGAVAPSFSGITAGVEVVAELR